MSNLRITLTIFAVLAVPGLLLCLGALAHDVIERRVDRRRA